METDCGDIVMNNVNRRQKIDKGKLIAIIGGMASGKTRLIDYILDNNECIMDIKLSNNINKNIIGYSSQIAFIINGSLK